MVAMSAVVYYVLPGLLGRAYDLKNDTVGPDLFSVADTQKAMTIKRYMTTSEYRVVSEIHEANDFLDVSGKLSLKLKTGAINIEGSGKYLKESRSFENRVDLLIKVNYETVVETLPSYIKPRPEWDKTVEGTGMTHYIRSIAYGGDLIASVRFITSNAADKEIIKAEIQGELNAKSGSFGFGLKGSLDKIKEKTRDSAFMDINYFATVPLTNIPRTIDGVAHLVEKFPELTKKVNNGKGVPLNMEVFSLTALNREIPTYFQTLAMANKMLILDEMLTDVRNTKQNLAVFLKTIPPVLEEEQNKKIGDFYTNLEKLDRIFVKTISEMDLSEKGSSDQFKPALDAYLGNRTDTIPNMYFRDLYNLKKEVLDASESFEVDFGGANFNYWGSDTCPESLKTLYSGYMSSTHHREFGSMEFICLPSKIDHVDYEEPDDRDITDFAQVKPLAFVTHSKEDPIKKGNVPCSNCRIPGKSSVTTIPGYISCPRGWDIQYTGVMVSFYNINALGDMVCLDVSKPFPFTYHFVSDPSEITEASLKPPGHGDASNAIPCVVCSKTKKSEKVSDYLRF